MVINDFVPFCNENTGTNLPTQSAYLANPNLPIGNQPGIASSSFNNKAIRQGSTMASVIAQLMANQTGADVTDDYNNNDHAVPPKLLAILNATIKPLDPVVTQYTSGSGNHLLTYKFMCASANATVNATYTDSNSTVFTVTATISAGTELKAKGGTAPAVSGVLTKTGGTGDATITYYAVRSPLYLVVKTQAGGGGGGGSGTTSGTGGGTGGTTSFGSFISSAGGFGGTTNGTTGGAGGVNTFTSPGVAIVDATGGDGGPAVNSLSAECDGGNGGNSALGGGGAGNGGTVAGGGTAGKANTGGGGGGGSMHGSASGLAGAGGGAGAYAETFIPHSGLTATTAYSVGGSGTAGTAGSSGGGGSAGGTGSLTVIEHYQ